MSKTCNPSQLIQAFVISDVIFWNVSPRKAEMQIALGLFGISVSLAIFLMLILIVGENYSASFYYGNGGTVTFLILSYINTTRLTSSGFLLLDWL